MLYQPDGVRVFCTKGPTCVTLDVRVKYDRATQSALRRYIH